MKIQFFNKQKKHIKNSKEALQIMKKSKTVCLILLALVLVIVGSAALFAACGPKNDPKTLNIVALNAGYGKEWLEKLADKFEADHPGYKVNLDNAIHEAPTLISSHINSKNNIDDLYISVGSSWKTYAAQGKFVALDDFVEEEVDNVKIKDRLNAAYANSIYFPDKNGTMHTYRLPWTAEIGGIYYNKTMFDKYGWGDWLKEKYTDNTTGLPETYAQLKALCDKIVEDSIPSESGMKAQPVKPFVYTGANPDYFDYTVYTWWAQLSGEEAMREFFKYKSASNWNTSNPTYANLQKATQLWKDLLGNSDYVMDKCEGMSNHTAQTNFANGRAAMMFNGGWLYNEILDYEINNDFELGLMKTPVVEGAKDSSIVYTIGEDQYIAIPASSTKQELAKDFIKLIVSDFGCKTFLEEAHGVLAYNGNINLDDIDDNYLKNMMQVKNSYEHAFTDYPTVTALDNAKNSTSLLWFSDLVMIWGTASLRPYQSLISSNPKSVEEAFSQIAGQVSGQWSTWKTNAGIN